MTIQEVVNSELKRGTLTKEGIHESVTEDVLKLEIFHHEWARTPGGSLVCCMIASFPSKGGWVAHDLTEKTVYVPTQEQRESYVFIDD